jgi:sialic acid synthase SpsE
MTDAPLTCAISASRRIGDGQPCFVIAEIGSNHNHDFGMATAMIDAAAEAGVDAVKFQTFRAATHFSKFAPGFSTYEFSRPFELIQSLELDRTWHARLQTYCQDRHLVFLSSPCDVDAIDELDALGTPAFKLASFDLTDLVLLRHMARKGRPIILSTGMADWMDIQRAVDVCKEEGNAQIILLQCTSLYPAPAALANLRAMKVMRDAFGMLTGYSDHTEGDHVCLAAVGLGACLVEKHITLDRQLPGPDHAFSMEPGELVQMVRRIRDVEAALGDGHKTGPRPEEREMFEKGRRSLHAACRITAGEVITAAMVTSKRPGLGIAPYLMPVVIGRTARTDIDADQWITWDMI